MDGRIVTINGKRWTWRWWPFGKADKHADCDGPHKRRKEIRIRNSLNRPERQAKLMEIAIHEALHCADWSKDEEWVGQVAEDISRLLWRLGYRRQ